MDLPPGLELEFKDVLNEIERENNMPYVTSVERLAKVEGRLEGRIQLLQELLGVPVSRAEDCRSDECRAVGDIVSRASVEA